MREERVRIPSAWNIERLLRRGPLTDRQIAKYQARGFYSPEYRKARKEIMDKKRVKRLELEARREGNFLTVDGRLIYSPL